MKKLITLFVLCTVVVFTRAQTPFIKQVNYRGAFAPAPTQPWTDGWTEWDPQNVNYPTGTVDVTADITTNTTWTSGNVYYIKNLIYVTNGATLTIQPGTIIRVLKTAPLGQGNALVITKGSKINAVGTAGSPIVFTSDQATGSRAVGDWGGIIMLGKASLNTATGLNNIEGITASANTEFGGGVTPDDNDNSGNLKYVRIEFGGYVFQPNQEINGLTMGAVGRNTVIDYVQTSFTNDDAFEWFGGTVNCSHLVSYRNLDDDFDTDNGFSGSVQFCLAVRDPQIADNPSVSTSEGFESDNDAGGTSASPKTSAVFSNITVIGPFRGNTASSIAAGFRRGARIRRNSNLKVFNSILMDHPTGIFMDGSAVRANLQSGATKFKNNLIAGTSTGRATEVGTPVTLRDSLFTASQFNNDSLVSTTGILTSPYNFTSPDYRPASGSPALTNYDFSDAAFTGRLIVVSASNFIKQVSYRGAFAPSPAVPWTDSWTNWDPQNTNYPSATVDVTTNITTNTTWTSNNVYYIKNLIYVTNGATLTIQPGTIIRVQKTAPLGQGNALVITKGAKINASGTAASPIVFTSDQATGSRGVGDWGGIILLGRASLNTATGINNIEGIAATTNTEFGGGASPNDDDNSGVLKYVRIEFGGYVFQPNQEINGLTMGAVGRGTTIDYIQVSFINDDAFEWFGGTVNCSHLVAYRCLDDDWDTDNGFSGSVQFALGVRDPQIADNPAVSTSEGFESDNDAGGTTATPTTKALFTNVTDIGPFRGNTASSIASGFRRGARIRRNSNLKVFNSILMDHPTGVFIDGAAVRANLQLGTAKFKNNIVAGNTSGRATEPGTASTVKDSLFTASQFNNDSLVATTGILVTPYNFTSPDYRPAPGSPALTNVDFSDAAFSGLVDNTCPALDVPGAISGPANLYNCTGDKTYSIPAVSGAATYTWTVPAGITISSGQGTRTITVSYNLAAFVSGTISVVANNDCGNSSASSSLLVRDLAFSAPANPTGGPLNVCDLVGSSSTVTYTVGAINGAESYLWTVPSNVTIISGQGTRNLTVRFEPGFVTSAFTVQTVSSCFTSANRSFTVKASAPAAAVIKSWSGSADINPILNPCPYYTDVLDNESDIIQYTIRQDTLATGYTWTVSNPSTMTIVGSPNDTIVNVKYTGAFTFGTLTITKTSGCGNSSKSITIKKLGATKPGKMSALLNGTTTFINVCDVVGSTDFVRYSIAPSAYSTSYNWDLSNYETMEIVGGDSTGLSIDVKFKSGFTFGQVKVQAINSCSVSAFNALTVKAIIPVFPPLTVVSSTVPSGGTLCGATNVVLTTSSPATDSTTNDYVWTLPVGITPNASISSTLIGPGVGGTQYSTASNSIAIDFASGTKAAKITVAGRSACGIGKAISVTLSAVPAVPGDITVARICPDPGLDEYDLSIAAVTGVGGATPYIWKVPAGITIVSGQGTTSLRIRITGAPLTTANVTVASDNDCGTSLTKAVNYQTISASPFCSERRTSPSASLSSTIAELGSKIAPNPNNGTFTLRIQSTNVTDNAQIQIIDLMGRLVGSRTGVNNNGSIQVNISDDKLVNGTYIVKYTIGGETGTVKMIVQK